MGKLGDLIVNVGANTKDLNNKLGQVRKSVSSTMGNIRNVGLGMSAAVTAPLVALGAKSFNVAKEFEASMAKVKAVSGATGAEFKALEQDALRLGSSTSFTASEVSALQLEYAKLGFSSGEITQVTEATLNLAKATGSDLATSAEVAGATLRGFGLDASETARVTDVMAASFSTTALDMSSFQESMKYVAPIASKAGLSIEQTTALLGSLSNAGIKGSQAGTALRRIIEELGSTGGNVSEAIAKLAEEGLTLADAKDEVGRSAQSALLVLAENTEATAALTEEYDKATGTARKMAKVMDNTAAGSMAKMQSAIEGAQIKLGDALAPVLLKVANFVEKAANAFTQLDSGTQAVIATVLAIVAAIGPLLTILPGLATVATTVGPVLAGAFTMMTGPIGIAIMAIAAIAAAIYYFWDDVKVPLMNVINLFIELYNQNEFLRIAIAIFKQNFITAFKIAKQQVLSLIDAFGVLFRAIKTAFTDGFGAAFDVLTEGFSQIKDDFVDLGKELVEDYTDAFNNAKTQEPLELLTEEDMDGAMERFKSLFDWFSDTAESTPVVVKVKPKVIGPIDDIDIEEEMDDFEDDLDFDTTEFLAKLQKMRDAAKQAMQDIESAVKNAAGSLLNDLGSAIGKIIAEGASSVNLMGVALQNLANLLQDIGRALIQQAVAMIAFQKLLFKNPVAAAAAGVAFVAAGAILASKAQQLEVPALATGGLAYGPTTAIVGDNPNARVDPEVIAPLSKLKDMLGGSQVEVYGRISGRDILLANDRATRDRNRII